MDEIGRRAYEARRTRNGTRRLLRGEDREETPPRPRRQVSAAISTLFVFIAAPLAALLVESPLGWALYSISAVAGIVHFAKVKDRAMLVQFTFYLVMNLIAIMVRL